MRIVINTFTPRVLEEPSQRIRADQEVYNIPFDEGAAERAYNLITGLYRDNLEPTTLIAGPRAYLSLWVVSMQADDPWLWSHPDAAHIEVLNMRGKDMSPLMFRNVLVQLDMQTQDIDTLRITTGMSGLVHHSGFDQFRQKPPSVPSKRVIGPSVWQRLRVNLFGGNHG